MRTLYVHLGSTSAGSLLLRSPKIKSYNNPVFPPVVQHVLSSISMPDWSLSTPATSTEPYKSRGQLENENAELRKQLALAHQNVTVRNQIIEEANATMVFQNLGLKKMNQALHEQEEKAVTDRAKLFKGKAQCLSSAEFYASVVEMEETRKAKAAGKESKQLERQRKKEMKEEIEREWAEMKCLHTLEVEDWTKECSRLLELGTRKKDWPPKPKVGKKLKIPIVEEEESDEEEEPNEECDV
jgi:hypothetical protein